MATRKRKLSAYEQEQLKRQQAEWATANAQKQAELEQMQRQAELDNAASEAAMRQAQEKWALENTDAETAIRTAQDYWKQKNDEGTLQADQGWQTNLGAYDRSLSDLTQNTWNIAANLGISRGKWAGQNIAGGADRLALDASKSQAYQAYQNALRSIEQDRVNQGAELGTMQTNLANNRLNQATQFGNMQTAYNTQKTQQGWQQSNAQSALAALKQQQANDLYGMTWENYTPAAKAKAKQPAYNNPYTAQISGLGSARDAGMPQNEYDRIYKGLKYQSDAYEKKYQQDYQNWYYSTH